MSRSFASSHRPWKFLSVMLVLCVGQSFGVSGAAALRLRTGLKDLKRRGAENAESGEALGAEQFYLPAISHSDTEERLQRRVLLGGSVRDDVDADQPPTSVVEPF